MFTYIIIGAGSAGCVLANRLSADPACQVLLLEAGGPDSNPEISIPGRWSKLLLSSLDWSYQSTPQPHLNNRRIDLNRGKVLGGSSAINGMVYIRGHRWDYDQWAAMGNEQWSFADVLPYFQKAENFAGDQTEAIYGTDGPLAIAQIPDVLGETERFIRAGELAGLTRNPNFNGPSQEGVGPYHHNYQGGRRVSAADAYLKPALHRPNLQVATHAQATRILFEGRRAVGVEYAHDHQLKQAHAAAEVILCGGGINSPQLLLCSGIGPAAHLRQVDLPVLVDLPGVGENLQDHPLLRVLFKAQKPIRFDAALKGSTYLQYLRDKHGPLVSTGTFAGAFWKTQPDLPAPDMQVFFSIGELQDNNDFAISLSLMRPQSRGTVRLQSADPFAYPLIDPNYLADSADLRVFIDSLRIARQLVATPAFHDFLDHELAPGAAAQSDEELAAWVRQALATTWHYSGTCKMGNDPLAVVNDRLQVHGVDGLRVVDASIMPAIIGGNTHAPVIMIAEKAAELIRA
jgi:choline dehydrogenase